MTFVVGLRDDKQFWLLSKWPPRINREPKSVPFNVPYIFRSPNLLTTILYDDGGDQVVVVVVVAAVGTLPPSEPDVQT